MKGGSGIGTVLVLLALVAGVQPAAAASHGAFDANPQQHGLVVLDVRLRQKSLFAVSEGDLRGGTLRSATYAGQPPGAEHEAKALIGVVPFAVAPGRYR